MKVIVFLCFIISLCHGGETSHLYQKINPMEGINQTFKTIRLMWDDKEPDLNHQMDHLVYQLRMASPLLDEKKSKEIKEVFVGYFKTVVRTPGYIACSNMRRHFIGNCFKVFSLVPKAGILDEEAEHIYFYAQALNHGLIAQSPPSSLLLLDFFDYYRTIPSISFYGESFKLHDLFQEILLRHLTALTYYKDIQELEVWTKGLKDNDKLFAFLADAMMKLAIDSPSYNLYFREHHLLTDIYKHQDKVVCEEMAIRVIHNDITITQSPHQNINLIMGEALMSDLGDPIYYFAYLPQKQLPKSVVVCVYGGSHKDDPQKVLFSPLSAYNFPSINAMLQRNIAVIALNLVDLTENTERQANITPEMAKRVESSIYSFWKKLKKTPKTLHPAFESLESLRIFLEGSSYGGRGAVKFAENYSGTFDGYISWNGVHDIHLWMKNDVSIEHLSPMEGLDKIEDPLLILHSFNDQRVPLSSSLHLVHELSNIKKDHLVQFYMSCTGSRALTDVCSYLGHFYPDNKYVLEGVMDQIDRFVSPFSSSDARNTLLLSQWRYFRAELMNRVYANSKNVLNSIDQRFLGTSFSVYKNTLECSKPGFKLFNLPDLVKDYDAIATESIESEKFQSIWSQGYLPILSFYLLHTFVMGKSDPTMSPCASKDVLHDFQVDLVNSFSMKLFDLKREYVKVLEKRLCAASNGSLETVCDLNNVDLFDAMSKRILIKGDDVQLKRRLFVRTRAKTPSATDYNQGAIPMLLEAIVPSFTIYLRGQIASGQNIKLIQWNDYLKQTLKEELLQDKIFINHLNMASEATINL